LGELQYLDRRCRQDGVIFDQILTIGIFQCREGDEEEFTLGDEGDLLVGIGGEEIRDRVNQNLMKLA
jgi:ferredoxin